MLVTEEEAKKRWCPMARNSGDGKEWHTNRPSFIDVDARGFDRCIASECMAWRPVRQYRSTLDDEWGDLQFSADDYTREVGFCGLSGNPTAGG